MHFPLILINRELSKVPSRTSLKERNVNLIGIERKAKRSQKPKEQQNDGLFYVITFVLPSRAVLDPYHLSRRYLLLLGYKIHEEFPQNGGCTTMRLHTRRQIGISSETYENYSKSNFHSILVCELTVSCRSKSLKRSSCSLFRKDSNESAKDDRCAVTCIT